ncbi:hypothetical protein Tco_0704392 [Tanacetum coccineum]|uniref:Uncharacterized protein n=1 Tax=Tanacetum coccineum TaxID=301880 RepID=A0ABQ4Y317_9ASTR
MRGVVHGTGVLCSCGVLVKDMCAWSEWWDVGYVGESRIDLLILREPSRSEEGRSLVCMAGEKAAGAELAREVAVYMGVGIFEWVSGEMEVTTVQPVSFGRGGDYSAVEERGLVVLRDEVVLLTSGERRRYVVARNREVAIYAHERRVASSGAGVRWTSRGIYYSYIAQDAGSSYSFISLGGSGARALEGVDRHRRVG